VTTGLKKIAAQGLPSRQKPKSLRTSRQKRQQQRYACWAKAQCFDDSGAKEAWWEPFAVGSQ